MSETWVLVANASRARVCTWDRKLGTLSEVADFVHPESRMSGRELGTQRSGHAQRSLPDGGAGGAALDARTDPRRKEHQHFARELAAFLDEAVKARRCAELVLVSSPPFLGELRTQLSPASDKVVQAVLTADLSSLSLTDLAHRLASL